ncbi:MAG TPA: hypothetical protein VMS64_13095 [Candidatus Methylomirabilis sp.]|nr:hypothetical protein [Candidatus Methylomirabilis sp.]
MTAALWVVVPAGVRASGEWIDDTLAERAREKGLLARTPLAGQFPRQRVEVVRHADPDAAVADLFSRRGWTDGLPIVPPTLARVDAALAWSARPREELLGEIAPLGGVATLEKVAANSVMAGCRPEYFPVVVAAIEAIVDPAFNLRGVQTTDENVAPLLIVNGPVAPALGINAEWGALGPGWRANATIGRAIRLVLNNIGGGWPGAVSFAGLGQPGRYTLCVAERAHDSPWPALHIELGYRPEQSTVTVLRAESAINVTGGLDELASVIGSAASLFAMLHEGKVAALLAPFVARKLAREGWDKADVKRYLHARGRLATETWRRSWIHSVVRATEWPAWVTQAARSQEIPALRDPEDITVVVAGADLEVPQHAYFPSWGHPPCRVTREILMPDDWAERLSERD